MASIFTPLNQVKLTNISVVRLKKGGKRFELACYKNTVLDYRNKLITDIDEVLQTNRVFLNVSKGQFASTEELKKAFGDKKHEEIVNEILIKGELQVGDKERAAQLESMTKDIITIITDKCIHQETRRPFPSNTIEKALSEIHFSVSLSKNSKQQALEAIKIMQEKQALPIIRAQMKVKIELPLADAKKLKENIHAHLESIESEEWDEEFLLIGLMNPGKLRELNDLITSGTKGKGKFTTLSMKEVCDVETLL